MIAFAGPIEFLIKNESVRAERFGHVAAFALVKLIALKRVRKHSVLSRASEVLGTWRMKFSVKSLANFKN